MPRGVVATAIANQAEDIEQLTSRCQGLSGKSSAFVSSAKLRVALVKIGWTPPPDDESK